MGRFARRFLRSACLNEVFCPVGHGRREKVGPAGKGPAYQKAVESDAVFLVHADARREREAAGGFRAARPLAAGIMELMSTPCASLRVKGIVCRYVGSDIA